MAARGDKKKTVRKKTAVKRPAPLRPRPATSRSNIVAFSPAFARQRGHASAKDLLIFELQRARVTVNAALQGVPGGAAERRVQPGGWTIRELVLHLAVSDRIRLEEFDSALAGTRASWALIAHDAMATVNEMHLQPLRALSWDEAVRLLQTTRAQLLDRVVAVSPEPEDVWGESHAFGAMLRGLPPHDRHHADQIKNARIQG